jgi:hypothetical protein
MDLADLAAQVALAGLAGPGTQKGLPLVGLEGLAVLVALVETEALPVLVALAAMGAKVAIPSAAPEGSAGMVALAGTAAMAKGRLALADSAVPAGPEVRGALFTLAELAHLA